MHYATGDICTELDFVHLNVEIKKHYKCIELF